jgi:hypothetical protein
MSLDELSRNTDHLIRSGRIHREAGHVGSTSQTETSRNTDPNSMIQNGHIHRVDVHIVAMSPRETGQKIYLNRTIQIGRTHRVIDPDFGSVVLFRPHCGNHSLDSQCDFGIQTGLRVQIQSDRVRLADDLLSVFDDLDIGVAFNSSLFNLC